MIFDFDTIIAREQTNAVKLDARAQYFGDASVTPLWVADMDFSAPAAVRDALVERAQHPIYGYSLYPESLYQSLIDWFARRHKFAIDRSSILMAPGIVPSLYAAVQAFTQVGEGVIVQPPVYFPFFSAVTQNNRNLLLNPLLKTDTGYAMDFEHLEFCAQQGAKLLLLCSPHNPVGRVWRRDELAQLLDITRRYDITIVSDEIHCDLVYSGNEHIVLQRMAEPEDKIITTLAPNKTFNIPGLGLSALVINHAEQRKLMRGVFESLHVGNTNPFSICAFEAAYNKGEAWLDALLPYLQTTRDFVVDYAHKHLPKITLSPPESTYLLWLDCQAMGMSDDELKHFFIKKANLGLSPGMVFGSGGSGFMRMNIGSSKAIIKASLNKLTLAFDLLK